MLTGGDSAAHCVRCGMVRTTGRKRGEKKGGGRNSVVFREPASAALLFPFFYAPCARHSARHGVPKRNLLFFNAE